MFRDGRRKQQFMSKEAAEEMLHRGLAGVLGVNGDDGYPYTVPVNYVYENGKIYFHSAASGHKMDSIRRNDKVSFCVIDQDKVVPEELTTYYRSVIAFGRAYIVEDETEKRHALELLGQKYAPDYPEKAVTSIGKALNVVSIVVVVVEHMSAKQAKDLLR